MRRTILLIVTFFLTFMIGSSTVLAANPHFVGRVKATDQGTTLQVTGSIAGLGNENIDVQVVAEGFASIDCRNPGGNVAPGQRTSVTVTGQQSDLEVKNGRANFNVTTAEPPAPDPAVVCPNPQWTAEITDVTFTSYTINVFQPAGSGNLVLSQQFTL